MKHNLISIDLAKNSFQLCAFDQHNKVAYNKRLTRSKLINTLSQLEPTTVVMEACYSSNPWARKITTMGHDVKLIPPFQVKPFLVGNKNDANDAVAIAEASLRPKTRFVPVKTLEQQDLQSLERIRERMVKQRTALMNQLRGLISEYGITINTGASALKQTIPQILEAEQLTTVATRFVKLLYKELLGLENRLQAINEELTSLVSQNGDYHRLLEVHGIGPVTAKTLIAFAGNASQFKNGRQMAAWIGLVPRQHASGDVNRLGKISKRGNNTLRRLLIHGARSVIQWCSSKDDKLSRWIKNLLLRMHPCKVVVAVANKLARIAWVVLAKRSTYNPALV